MLKGVTNIVGDYSFNADELVCIRQLKVSEITYAEFAVNLLQYILSQAKSASCIGIVFGVYIKNTIKDIERARIK